MRLPRRVTLGCAIAARCVGLQLLVNGGPDPGAPGLDGWTITANGGEGWGRGAYEGVEGFTTSYEWCIRNQTVNLTAAGVAAANLTAIAVEQTVSSHGSAYDRYFMRVRLLDAAFAPLGAYGDAGPGGARWLLGEAARAHTFDAASLDGGAAALAAARYVEWSDGGFDPEYSIGRYGPSFRDAAVRVTFAGQGAPSAAPSATPRPSLSPSLSPSASPHPSFAPSFAPSDPPRRSRPPRDDRKRARAVVRVAVPVACAVVIACCFVAERSRGRARWRREPVGCASATANPAPAHVAVAVELTNTKKGGVAV